MQDKNDLVSIIIPTYGRCEYLKRAVDSVLKQTYTNVEVIVVDDNGKSSPQGIKTQLLMNHYHGNSRVIYIQHQVNKNGSAARNTGLSAAKGGLIGYLDDDDEFLPKKVETQVFHLNDQAEYNAVYCLNSKYYNGKRVQTTTYTNSGNCQLDILCIKSDIHTSSLLMRRNAIIGIGGWDESYSRHQDFEFLIRFFENNTIKCIPEVFLNVHVESEINRPSVDKLIAAKKVYFDKLNFIISRYNVNDKNDILKAHNLELFRVCVKRFDVRLFEYLKRAKPNLLDVKQYLLPVAIKTIKKLLPHKKNNI